MALTTKNKIDAAEEIPRRKTLPASRIALDSDGYVTRRFFIRLPAGWGQADLVDPSAWSEIQRSTLSLRKFDEIRCASYAEDFLMVGTVTEATASAVVVSWQKLISAAERVNSLFADELYAVRWDGVGYAVYRKSDGQKVSQTHSSEQQAVWALRGMYPRSV
jgi:hypothetical protein